MDTTWQHVRQWRVQMRRYLISARLARPSPERSREGEQIKAALARRVDLNAYTTLGIYWPVRGEIDVRDLALAHLRRGGRIALPVVVTPFAPVEFWNWHADAPMTRGVWNIPIPVKREVLLPDALLVPLVGFDSGHYRLGYGGGYYDRTLAAAPRRPFCVGLGYPSSRLATIFPQAHDIPMDMIISDPIEG
ncbi:MAG: 5-formyltetrahydrofolate cyclo-ligase [Proteobacteria bacterium]|nr:5-formyltetrahydrofolate cyclo-ligase [Pseudomonadota bacterium]